MADVLREIFVLLGMKTDEKSFAKSMLAVDALKKGAETIVETFKELGERLFQAIEQTAGEAEQLQNLSKTTGLSADMLQGLSAAAAAAGMDLSTAAQGMRGLSLQMFQAMQGGDEAASAFARLGVRVTDAAGKLRPLEEVVGDVAARFEQMPDGPEKLALAARVFGKAGQNMILVLEELAFWQQDAKDAGATMSKDMLGQANALDRSFDRFGLTMKGLRNAIVGPLLEPLTGLVNEFSKWIRANKEIIGSAIVRVVKVLGAAMYFVYRISVPVVELFLKFADTAVGTATIIGVLVAALVALSAAFIGAALAAAPLVAELVVAGLPIMGIVLGILALLAVLGLLAEDIYGYFTGKQSVFGLFVEGLKKLGQAIEATAIGWFTTAVAFWKQQFLDFIAWLSGKWETLPGWAKAALQVAAAPVVQAAEGGLQVAQWAGLIGGPAQGGTPATNPSFRANFTINTTPGMDPAAVGTAVRESMDDWFSSQMSRAYDSQVGQFSPAGGP